MRLASCSIIPIVVQIFHIATCTEFNSAFVVPASAPRGHSARPQVNELIGGGFIRELPPYTPSTPQPQVPHHSLTSLNKPSVPQRRWWARARHLMPRRPFSRARAVDRRLFFSFNQLLLSLIAPRLMRYQFDLMMHSVVSELFRKVLVPVVGGGMAASGTGGAGAGDSSSIFSSIGNLLRGRQTAPRTTTAAPTVDVQRLLDNAQKLIALQTLLRNKPSPSSSSSASKSNSNPISQEHITNSNANQELGKPRQHSLTDTQIGRHNSSQSKPNTSTANPIQLAISTKDFISFLQNNFKPKQANSSTNSITKGKGIVASEAETSSRINHMHGTSFGHNHLPTEAEVKVSPSDRSNKKSSSSQDHRMRVDDFKMSHLTFIDTEVPNYGNQLLVQDDVTGTREDPNKSQMGMIESAFLNDKEMNSLKDDDLERANRWNDVLVNMYDKTPNG